MCPAWTARIVQVREVAYQTTGLRQIIGSGQPGTPAEEGNVTDLMDNLRRAILRNGAGLGDGELLGSFIERHDEAALAALVRRHGPMVWRVCRRLLPHHDAEDAFQATFLILVRKAASVVPREMVANWLYGVAHQTALHARRTASRRRTREVQVEQMPDPEAVREDRWADVRPVLDEELSRLPDIYRAVIVLCELEGRSRKETARQLGVPDGTVGGRLARARVLLAKRLARRGIVLSGGALAAVLAQNAASADVPHAVVVSTISAACAYAAGRAATPGVISAQVAALTEGVLKVMLVSKLKIAMALLLVLACVGGPVAFLPTTAGQQPPAGKKSEATKTEEPTKQQDEKKGSAKDKRLTPGKVAGVVSAVDAQESLITVIVPTARWRLDGKIVNRGTDLKLQDVPVNKDTRITVKGKAGTLVDIDKGAKIVVELDATDGVITLKSLEVMGE
jgi:RNA polymerase sigma factor (sigma-70 family)